MKAEIFWPASMRFFHFSVASHTIMTYARNSGTLYFLMNANIENVNADHFQRYSQTLKETE